MLDFIGSLIGKGLDFFSNKSSNEQSAANTAATNATQLQINQRNIELQREFAQHGLSWKIDDAAQRGIHPLIALGAQGSSFTPQTVGLETHKPTPYQGFGEMGQDVGRALKAALSSQDREKADAAEARKLTLEKGRLENDILRTDLVSRINRTSRTAAQLGPPMPSSIARGDIPVPVPRPGPDRTAGGHAIKEDDIKQAPDDAPAAKVLRPLGIPLSTVQSMSDAQKLEDRYGEPLADFVFGPANTVADAVKSIYGVLPEWSTREYGHRPSAHERRWRRRY